MYSLVSITQWHDENLIMNTEFCKLKFSMQYKHIWRHNVKFTLEQATKIQRESRKIFLYFLQPQRYTGVGRWRHDPECKMWQHKMGNISVQEKTPLRSCFNPVYFTLMHGEYTYIHAKTSVWLSKIVLSQDIYKLFQTYEQDRKGSVRWISCELNWACKNFFNQKSLLFHSQVRF